MFLRSGRFGSGHGLLQGINLYVVCYVQHSYNRELHKVRYDYDSSIFLALAHMNAVQRAAYRSGLGKSQYTLRQPSQFQVAVVTPQWASESSPFADEACLTMREALESSSPAQIPSIKNQNS